MSAELLFYSPEWDEVYAVPLNQHDIEFYIERCLRWDMVLVGVV